MENCAQIKQKDGPRLETHAWQHYTPQSSKRWTVSFMWIPNISFKHLTSDPEKVISKRWLWLGFKTIRVTYYAYVIFRYVVLQFGSYMIMYSKTYVKLRPLSVGVLGNQPITFNFWSLVNHLQTHFSLSKVVLSSPFQETEAADISWLPVRLGDRERVCSQAPEQMCPDAFGKHKPFPRGSLLGKTLKRQIWRSSTLPTAVGRGPWAPHHWEALSSTFETTTLNLAF